MTKKKFQDRRYQIRTIESFNKWKGTDGLLGTIILPTGTGKTFTAARCLDHISGAKILWVAHREELIDQAYDTLADVVTWTDSMAKEMAENKADPHSDIVVGSVQTLARKRKHLATFKPDFIIIDEYHHRSEKNVTYQGLINRFPNAKIIGLTATPWRFSGEKLPLGEVLFEMDIGTAIAHNYLVPAIPEILKSKTSLAGVKTRMGDFATGELSKAVNVEERNKLISKRILSLVKDEGRQGILFGVDVAHAHDMYEMLNKEIRVAEVYGDTPKDERRYLMEKIRNGEIDCLCNNLVATEGFDVPHLSFAGIARPTRALGLYIQMAGRVLRTSLDKNDAIILDVYDKLKIKQSRVTFSDMAYEGDMYGDKKRANNILTADINWKQPDGSGHPKPPPKSDNVAVSLINFPVFMVHDEEDRWTTDDDFMPITSWSIANDQRLITWTEEQLVQRMVEKLTWKPLTIKPTRALIKQTQIKVKHNRFGEGRIIDIGFGLEVKIVFDGDGWMSGQTEFLPINELLVGQRIKEFSPEQDRMKIDRLFYLCFPSGIDQGRMIEMKRNKKNLHVLKDQRMTKKEATEYIVNAAKNIGVLPLVRSNAKWKKAPISASQRSLINNFISGGKIRFDLDVDTMTKGDASAIIDQIKWQKIINEKFGATSKDKLLGYDSSVEDV